MYAPSQWETTLQCKVVYHWLVAYTKQSPLVWYWYCCSVSERNWNMWIPGFGSEELKPFKKSSTTEAHKQVSDIGNSPYFTTNHIINTLGPRHNGCDFADDIFKYIFLKENAQFFIKISLKDPIDNVTALVQVMVWRRPADKPLSEPIMVRSPTHIWVTWPQWINVVLCIQYLSVKEILNVSLLYEWKSHWEKVWQ